ncbi:DUF1302 domain-containing protein [Thalassotalea ponticola]|uniref:DUF1302 domain-containing protein n=1 Tax=Thalassotalea ponticola TaxID=1523392 RepID=UPI0025B6035F|nr:DUF1302 domain-containing protein [Thalassotalea ponticola]MDN3651378.1 DUF1302 domain-containing protein [Thalassotalea ponticola]
MKPSSLRKFGQSPVAKSVAAGLLMLSAMPAQAIRFDLGEFEVSFDSTFSYGESYRVEDRDWNGTIAKSNNLNNNLDWMNNAYSQGEIWALPGSYSSNGDLGNLNYDSGEAFSKTLKGSHDLDIRYAGENGDYGFFGRAMYFYDFEMMDSSRPYTNPLTGQEYSPCDDEDAKDEICRDIRLLDAFLYADMYVGDVPVSVRIGDQLIGWGESTLIAHGISEINPIDIARLRAPGAELKEAFIPFGSVWASVGVTENFNIEAFYQYRWEETILPAPGSYFSSNDFAGSGGYNNNIQLGFGGTADINLDALIAKLNEFGSTLTGTQADAARLGEYVGLARLATLTEKNDKAKMEPEDGGQYGVKFGYFFPELNDTELALYYINYHSRRPLISGQTANFGTPALIQDLQTLGGGITEDNITDLNAFAKAKFVFPEDINLYGLSFNTTVGLTSVAGEVTYRQDEPLQIDDVELLFAAVPEQLANAGLAPLGDLSQMKGIGPGELAQGYIQLDTVQAQMTFTHLWGPTFGAGQFTTLLEVGGISIKDMPAEDVLRLNGPGGARSGTSITEDGRMALFGGTETNPFPTDSAWGYRILASLDYNDVFMGINMKPRVVFSHDVDGITPDPLFLFVEDRKSISAGVTFDYQNRWSAAINYNAFYGGVGTTNQLADRDFVSFNIKYSI